MRAAARRIATLYREELKATTRGQFVWLGAGVVLLGVGGVATVGTQDTWLDVYGVIAYFLVPLAFIPLAAIAMAAPRANRFVESLFTAPVERRDWLIAKVLVLLTLAAAYYAALVPMMVVYVAHVGVPPLLTKLLLWAPGLLVASLAVGTLVGVLYTGPTDHLGGDIDAFEQRLIELLTGTVSGAGVPTFAQRRNFNLDNENTPDPGRKS